MKGLILAGGYGTRLYPLTKDTAKPLVNVHDTPIITRLLRKLESVDLDEIYVVTNDKFADQLRDWADEVDSDHDITVFNDGTKENGERLGTLGDIKHVVHEAGVDDDLLVVGGDNLFEFSIDDFVTAYQDSDGSLIAVKDLTLDEVRDSFGVVETDEDDVVTGFEEKPSEPSSSLASTLLYALQPEDLSLLDAYLARGYPSDDAGNFIKYLSSESHVIAYDFDDAWFDIGTKERLEDAEDYYDA